MATNPVELPRLMTDWQAKFEQSRATMDKLVGTWLRRNESSDLIPLNDAAVADFVDLILSDEFLTTELWCETATEESWGRDMRPLLRALLTRDAEAVMTILRADLLARAKGWAKAQIEDRS